MRFVRKNPGANASLFALHCEAGGFSELAPSDDGSLLLVVAYEELSLWELASEAQRWRRSPGKGLRAALSPGCDRVAFSTMDGEVGVLDARSGEPLWRRSLASYATLQRVSWSADGREIFLVVNGELAEDRQTKVSGLAAIDAGTGAPSRPPLATRSTLPFAFAPDRRRAVCGDSDGLRVYDLASWTEGDHLRCGHDVWEVAFAPDSSCLIERHDREVQLLDVASGRSLLKMEAPGRVLAVSQGGRFFAVGDAMLTLWERTEPEPGAAERAQLRGHSGSIGALAFLPDGRLVSAADRTVRGWSTAAAPPREHHLAQAYQLQLHPDGERALTASRDGAVKVWDRRTGSCIRTLHERGEWSKFTLVPGGERVLVSAYPPRELKLWDLASGQVVATLSDVSMHNLAFQVLSPRFVLIADKAEHNDPYQVSVWDMDRGKRSPLEGVAWGRFHGSKNRFFLCDPPGTAIHVFSLQEATHERTLAGHEAAIAQLWAPEADELLSIDAAGTLKQWDTAEGRCTRTVSTGLKEASMLWRTDDNVLYLQDQDGVSAWRLDTGEKLFFTRLRSREDPYTLYSFSVPRCLVTPQRLLLVCDEVKTDTYDENYDRGGGRTDHPRVHALHPQSGAEQAVLRSTSLRGLPMLSAGGAEVLALEDEGLCLRSLDTQRAVTLQPAAWKPAFCLWDEESGRVVAFSSGGDVALWDARTGALQASYQGSAEVLTASLCASEVIYGDAAGEVVFLQIEGA